MAKKDIKGILVDDPNDPSYKVKPEGLTPPAPVAAAEPQPTEQQPYPTFTEEQLKIMFPENFDGTCVSAPTGDEQRAAAQQAAAVAQPTQHQQGTTDDGQQGTTGHAIMEGQVAKMNEVIDPVTGKPKVDGTTPDTGNQEQVTTPSSHRFNWGQEGTTLDSVMKNEGKDTPIRQILDDYFRWSQENGKPIDYWTVSDILNGTSDTKNTPVDEEKERKKAERKAKWDQFGNFFLHLGNAIGNVGGGGYASVALEDPVQWTARQQQLRDKTLEQRRRNTDSILSQMRKDWEQRRQAQVAKQQAEHNARMAEIAQQRADDIKAHQAVLEEIARQTAADKTRKTDADIENGKKRADSAVERAKKAGRRGGSTKQDSTVTTTFERDRDGNVKQSQKKTTYGKPQRTKVEY